MNASALFNPRTISVIGAHNEEGHVGFALMKNLLSDVRGRKIIPVTEKFSEVLGIKAFFDVSLIEEQIDLAIIAVASNEVSGILKTCGQKKIPSVIIISAGFKEVGEEGARAEEELRQIALESGVTLIGPNCLGVINANVGMNATFSACAPHSGGISFISQSGAIATSLIDWSRTEGVGFSKIVSLGNEALFSEIEILEYLRDDTDTKAILLYLEHISDGKKFMELVTEITKIKPVVILRAGRSEQGGKAVMSHTGSLAPDDAVFSAAVSESGAIAVDTLRDLFGFAKLFQMGIMKPHSRIVIVTNGGGPSVNTADLVDLSESLSLVQLDDETKNYLKSVLPFMASVGNPIDVIGDAGSKRYADVLDILVKHSEIDAMIVIVTPQMMTNAEEIAKVVLASSKTKPIIPAFMGGLTNINARRILMEGGLVNFEFPTDAVSVLDLLSRGKHKEIVVRTLPEITPHSPLAMVDLETTQSLLAEYGIPLLGVFISKKEGLRKAIEDLHGDRFALKAISKDLVHKSDAGAVRIGISGKESIELAWDEIARHIEMNKSGTIIDGMLVQPMKRGREVIIGMKRDRTFGPVILFGLGGVFVEIIKDVAMRVAPISEEEALRQVSSIKTSALFRGVRGEKPVDVKALARIIVALSKLSLEHPEVEEIDLNPVMATENDAVIVDARFMKKNIV